MGNLGLSPETVKVAQCGTNSGTTQHRLEIITTQQLNNNTEDTHIIIFDNAPTHLKCEECSLSAKKMPQNLSQNLSQNFFVVTVHGPNR
jgi:hypothetical protein